MDEDDGFCADQLGALRDRAAMVAVGGAGEGHPGSNSTHARAGKIGEADLAIEVPRGFFQHKPHHRIGAAERLEGAEAEALALVLDVDGADAQRLRQRRQRRHRRRGGIVAKGQETLDLCDAGGAEAIGIGRH